MLISFLFLWIIFVSLLKSFYSFLFFCLVLLKQSEDQLIDEAVHLEKHFYHYCEEARHKKDRNKNEQEWTTSTTRTMSRISKQYYRTMYTTEQTNQWCSLQWLTLWVKKLYSQSTTTESWLLTNSIAVIRGIHMQ